MKAFASDMVRDHEAVNDKALALVKKLKVTPEDNDTSRTLSKNAAAGQQCRAEEPVATGLKIFQGHQQHAEQVAAELK